MNQIKRAAELVGSITKLARGLKVSTQAVSFWRDGKRRMPVEFCSDIERLTCGGVTRKDLRPIDWERIWPELAKPSDATQGQQLPQSSAAAQAAQPSAVGQGAQQQAGI